jgi:hypothetical protein
MPEWRDNYRGFPNIPLPKRWREGGIPGTATQEQIITNKLMSQVPINQDEINQLIECIVFYQNLLNALRDFNFSSLTEIEMNEFIKYIGYAYNYTLLMSNEIELYAAFRLVENTDKKPKEHCHQLSYPPIEIVKARNLYNRASSSNSTVFYCSETVDSTFMELRPSVDSIVTLGIWKPRLSNKFISYPIMHNPGAYYINDTVRTTMMAYDEIKKRNHILFGQFLDGYFNVLNREYSKSITDKKEYLISSFFSERIFLNREPEWNFDCIIYPSVGHDFTKNNFAFKSQVVDARLYLSNAYEFKVIETFYDRPTNNYIPTRLTVAKVEALKKLDKVNNDGSLKWI